MVVMVRHLVPARWRGLHRPQHLGATRAYESPAQDEREPQRGEVEEGRVIPARTRLKRLDDVMGGDEAEHLEERSDDEAGEDHRSVRGDQQVETRPPSVV